MPMPTPFDGYVEKPARVSSTCLVAVARNRYSVPCELAGQMVSTRLYPGRVVVVADDAIVAGHERLNAEGQTRYDWQHYIPLLQRKPGALRNGAPFADLPEPLQRLRRALLRETGGDRVMAQVLALVPDGGLEAVLVAVELALEEAPPSGRVSVEHVVNVLARLNARRCRRRSRRRCRWRHRRWPTRRATTACARRCDSRRSAMRDLIVELKQLRLHGMAGAWADLLEQGNAEAATSRWLLEHLLQAESADRAMRSVSHQMNAAKFPVHRDLAGFDFDASPVDRKLVLQLASWRSPRTRTTSFWSVDPAPARRIWRPPSAWPASRITASGCASTRPSIWSTRWSRRRRRAGPDALPQLAAHGPGHPGRTGIPALQPGRRGVAVPPAGRAVRAHQRADHDQPRLRRVVQRVRRREDDDGVAGPAHASLPHRGDRQREPSLPAQQRGGQEAHQGARAGPQGDGASAADVSLTSSPRGEIRYGLRPSRLPPRNASHIEGGQPARKHYTYPQPVLLQTGLHPGSKFDRRGGSKLNRRGQSVGRIFENRVPLGKVKMGALRTTASSTCASLGEWSSPEDVPASAKKPIRPSGAGYRRTPVVANAELAGKKIALVAALVFGQARYPLMY